MYKMYVGSAEEISKQRATSNSFFMTVNAAIITVFVLLGKESDWQTLVAMCVFGILLTFIWRSKIDSYKRLNDAKFILINKMEEKLAAMLFFCEWKLLDLRKHTILTAAEKKIPTLFMGAYIVVGGLKLWPIISRWL